MNRLIFKNKNKIMVLSAILIFAGLVSSYIFDNAYLKDTFFLIASIIALLPILMQAIGSIKIKVISIDVLVSIAVIAALIIKNYEESGIVTFLFIFGSYLEQKTLNNTRSAIKSLIEMSPKTAIRINSDGDHEEVDIDDLNIDDDILVKTGSQVPVDGSVSSGVGYMNEASITGESMLIKKEKGDEVFSGSILENGTVRIVAEKIGEDTTFGKIIELLEEAQDSKSATEKFINSFSKYYTPLVLLLAFLVYIFTKDIELAITILVLGCPGALVIGVPVSNVAGIGNGAKNVILFKTSEVIKDFSKIDTVIFDKTGTITKGHPEVIDHIFYTDEKSENISMLLSVERESDHPLAKAIIEKYENHSYYETDGTEVVEGKGIIAKVLDKKVIVGNLSLIEKENIELSDKQKNDIDKYLNQAYSIILMAYDDKLQSLILIRDKIKEEAKDTIEDLKKEGIKDLIMLSGDNQKTVDIVCDEIGLTKGYGGFLPQDKSKYVKKLIDNGHTVAFIGDGINDSPSLSLANVGISMGNGTDIAIETSDIVLMNSDIRKIQYAHKLSKKIHANMIQNIFIAVFVVFFLLYSLLFNNWLNMSLGMLIHEASIFLVILNGMRLIRNNKNKGE
ncbi:heavy metal translocating P-type ATPase [uncultured Helcococcus sp.]|uniref:heavy metal translocating P-type ATPase n=1 Tax=uncultured Helcococcus sp. TaxID=1072508 RepID=UPI00262F6AA2|nr:heavy metal translocating P-type ATPase [uncultured Helcococcus sp.]